MHQLNNPPPHPAEKHTLVPHHADLPLHLLTDLQIYPSPPKYQLVS